MIWIIFIERVLHQIFTIMKNQFYNEFSVQELEARLEMKGWIRIEEGPCPCDDSPGTEL